jgi:predicted transcriptional regulator
MGAEKESRRRRLPCCRRPSADARSAWSRLALLSCFCSASPESRLQRPGIPAMLKYQKVTPHNTMPRAATTSLKLDPATKDRVQRLASARRRTAHWIMREAVEQYVEREEKREQFRQDALAAWDHYQATGLHVTGAEADAWLAKLEAGTRAAPPKCHK